MFEKRMSSFIVRGQKQIEQGNVTEARKMVTKGLQYYSEKVVKSISPYAKADAGLVVIALRHIADEVERNNPGTAEFASQLDKCVIKPDILEIEKVQRANKR